MAGPGKCCRFNVLTVTRSAVARGVVTHRVWWDPVRRTLIHRCCMTETTLRLWHVQNSSSSQEKWPRTLPGTYLLLAFSVAGNCQRENLVKKLARDEGLNQEKNSQEVGLTQINVCSYTHIPPTKGHHAKNRIVPNWAKKEFPASLLLLWHEPVHLSHWHTQIFIQYDKGTLG